MGMSSPIKNDGDRMMYWAKVGEYWGGFWGLLFGSTAFAIPGFGPVLMAGPPDRLGRSGRQRY